MGSPEASFALQGRDFSCRMTTPQLRKPLFDGPAFINFLPPGEDYSSKKVALGIPWNLWSPCSNPLMIDCLSKAGFKIVKNTKLSYEGLTGLIWDTLCPAARAAVILKTASSKEALRNLLANAACEDLQDLDEEAKVNRMPGTQVLTCKLKIARRHKEFRQRFGKKDFNFIPETFSLLDEREDVLQSMTVRKHSLDTRSGEGGEDRKVWIVKPIGLSRGRGIFLTDNPIALPAKDNNGRGFLVQRYIADPYLIRGRKFDLRVYLLITGINPLKFYIYKDGFMRFATELYGEGEKISNLCAHITNQSLHEDNVVGYFGEKKDLFSGFKWTLKTLSIYFRKQGIDWSQVWGRIEDVCRKTVLLAHKDMQVAATSTTRSSYNCYKLLGLDILLDSQLQPWVLEVNSDPVLHPDSVDFPVKSKLIPEMFNILGLHIPQEVVEANITQLREHFPGIAEFGHDASKYESNIDEDKDWSAEDFQKLIQNGELGDEKLGILRQAEEELAQTSCFSRLLPQGNSERYLGYMTSVPSADRLCHLWEQWKLQHPTTVHRTYLV